MKIARAYLSILICSLALFGIATTAHAQSASHRQTLETEMAMVVSGMRMVAGCPALMEDWEYAVLADAASNITYQLTGTYYLSPSVLRSLYTQADAKDCAGPAAKQKAAKLRAYAHSRWLGLSRAFLREPACPKPSPAGHAFLKAFEKDVIQTYQRKKVPGPTFAEIEAYTKNITPTLRQACKAASGYFKAQTTSLAPLIQLEKKSTDEDVRHRDFDFNSGFTLGIGDADDPHWARKSGVTAQRSSIADRQTVVAKYSACGGLPLKNPLAITQRVRCLAKLDSAGNLIVEITPHNPAVKLASVTLDILDLRTGQPVVSKKGKADIKGRSAPILGALDIFKNAAPYHQVHIRLGLSQGKADPVIVQFHYSDKIKGPATVAAIDFVKAAKYAFAPKANDLNENGMVVRNAKAYEADD